MQTKPTRVFSVFHDTAELKPETINFLNSYCFKLYPKRLRAFSAELRKSIAVLVEKSEKGTYSHALNHYINPETERYSFDEIFSENAEGGLNISIIPCSEELRKKIADSHEDKVETSSVSTVTTYLKDSLENESEYWVGAAGSTGQCWVEMLNELIDLLERSKHMLRVLSFGFKRIEKGQSVMEMTLVATGVVNYCVQITW